MRNKIIPYNPQLKARARQLRQAGNLAEALLWRHLKHRQIMGFDFHRQKPLDNYIVDFYCPELLLAIEIDGVTHAGREEADCKRQQRLESLGVKFLRFLDSDVRENVSGVIETIAEWVEQNR